MGRRLASGGRPRPDVNSNRSGRRLSSVRSCSPRLNRCLSPAYVWIRAGSTDFSPSYCDSPTAPPSASRRPAYGVSSSPLQCCHAGPTAVPLHLVALPMPARARPPRVPQSDTGPEPGNVGGRGRWPSLLRLDRGRSMSGPSSRSSVWSGAPGCPDRRQPTGHRDGTLRQESVRPCAEGQTLRTLRQ